LNGSRSIPANKPFSALKSFENININIATGILSFVDVRIRQADFFFNLAKVGGKLNKILTGLGLKGKRLPVPSYLEAY